MLVVPSSDLKAVLTEQQMTGGMDPREPPDPLLPRGGVGGAATPPPPICQPSHLLSVLSPDLRSPEPDILPGGQDVPGSASSPELSLHLAPTKPSLRAATPAPAASAGLVEDALMRT